jgi:hypothetical protein
MFGNTFGHGTLRKYIIYFGTLFNNIWINRYDSDGDLIQNMKVPLNYGPRDKFLARLDGNPDLKRPIAIQLPRMSFEVTNITYDSSRKLPLTNKISAPNPSDPTGVLYQYMPVPYNLDITLSIMVKNAEDGTYIVEQILPYFNPMWSATLNLVPEMGIKHDIPITLDNIVCEDTYEGDFMTRRAIIWTLNFTLKGYFFGPTISANTGIIKEIDLNMRIPPGNVLMEYANQNNSPSQVSMEIFPAQYANGQPANGNNAIFEYSIARPLGQENITFFQTEKVSVDSNNYFYIKAANSTHVTTSHVYGVVANGDSITTNITNGSGVINFVTRYPTYNLKNYNTIQSNTDFGFIINLYEDY